MSKIRAYVRVSTDRQDVENQRLGILELVNQQDTGYVLGYFGKKQTEARKEYESSVKEGISQGRREDLTGGGLIRSLGGWTSARDVLRNGPYHERRTNSG